MGDRKKEIINSIKSFLKAHKSFVILFIVLVVVLIFLYNYKPSIEGMTLKKYNKITIGMTYKEVIDITGEVGKVLSERDEETGDANLVQVYQWFGYDGASKAEITFKGGKVIIKKQEGLKGAH